MGADGLVSLSLLTCVLAGVIVCLIVIHRLRNSSNGRTLPPLHKGWLPWMGCAFEFGVSPLSFLEQKRKELGSVFTLYVAGERLTFITDADDFHHFFLSSNVDFQKAVQDPVQRVASVSVESFFLYHTKIHDMVKGRLASSRLPLFHDKLCQEFNQTLQHVTSQDCCDLYPLVRRSMYKSVMNNLFGEGVLPVSEEKRFNKLEENFVLFDELFEYGARLPPFAIKNWTNAKWWLINMFRDVAKKVLKIEVKEGESETLLQTLLHMVDDKHAPNYALLLLWASLANAIPITFWTLSFILSNPDVLNKLKKEVLSITDSKPNGSCIQITEDDLRKMPYLKYSVLEAIRLRPTGIITRRVVKPFSLKGFMIPEGDMLMLSPYWAHRNNQKCFNQSDRYWPERWESADLEKNVFLEGFVAFGGGRYQCPGRWYALMEIQMYVALFLHKFDCKSLCDVPKPSMKHLVGTQQPDGQFLVDLKVKKR